MSTRGALDPDLARYPVFFQDPVRILKHGIHDCIPIEYTERKSLVRMQLGWMWGNFDVAQDDAKKFCTISLRKTFGCQ